MGTINDVAELAGVSIATVSRAFNNDSSIKSSTRDKILEISKNINYVPKKYHKHKNPNNNCSIIGVIISCRNSPWCNLIMSGICNVMEKYNITPVFADTNETPYKEIVCMDKLKDFVKGMLIVSSTELNDYSTKYIAEINQSIPIVTLVRNTALEHIDSVAIDSFHHTFEAINLLVDNGHSHIAIINGPMVIKPSLDRFAGYIEVLRARNIPIRNEYIYYGDFDETNDFNITNELLDSNPRVTAIFSANTAITRGALKAIESRGLKIPDDIAFISYGDDYSFSFTSMNITAIVDPDYEIGCKAASLLLSRIQEDPRLRNRKPKRIVVKPNLVLRGSEVFPKNRASSSR